MKKKKLKLVAHKILSIEEESNLQKLSKEHKDYFTLNEDIIRLGYKLLPKKIPKFTGYSPMVYNFVIGLCVKTFKTLRSIQLLCRAGLIADATALSRVLLETSYWISYISDDDVEKHAQDYEAMNVIYKKKESNRVKNTRFKRLISQRMQDFIDTKYIEILKRKIGKKYNLPQNKIDETLVQKYEEEILQKKPFNPAENARVKTEFKDDVYILDSILGSQVIHCRDIIDNHLYVDENDNLCCRILSEMNRVKVDTLLSTSGGLFLKAIEKMNEICKLGYEEKISGCFNHWKKLKEAENKRLEELKKHRKK